MTQNLLKNIVLASSLLLTSLLNAQSWTRCSNGLPAGKQVLSLATIGNTLIAGTDKGGVFKSSDQGLTWTSLPPHNNLTQTQTWSMAVIDTFIFCGQRGNGILKGSVNGSSWAVCNNGLTNKVLQDVLSKGDTLLTATYGGGIFISTDRANSWSKFDNNAGMNDGKIFSLTNNSSYYFTGTAGTDTYPDTGVIYRHPVNGNRWDSINHGLGRNGVHLEGIFSMDANDQLAFAGTDDIGIFRSTDNGSNWTMVHKTADVHSIKIVGNHVFYGTSYSGVYVSHDGGLTWQDNNSGLVYNGQTLAYLVKDFAVMGGYIYAATDMGVFKQPLPGADVTELATLEPEILYFRDQKEIRVSGLESGDLVSVYNVTGQQMLQAKGELQELTLLTSELRSGIYLVVVQQKAGVRSQKLYISN